ncbi:MAG: hypothetical protein PVJ39_14775 [Gammaproteobacteria bacterium]|jgi:hypothetical protein
MSVKKLLISIQLILPVILMISLLVLAFDAHAGDRENPSMELLEFLGEWQTKDGEWVDPMRFLDIDEKDLSQKQRDRDPHSKVNVNEDIRDD